MSLLYCTADHVGIPTGGGAVTAQELQALQEFSAEMTRERSDPSLSSVEVFSRDNLGSDRPEPWKWDEVASCRRDWFVDPPRLAHFYSGTFGKTVGLLKRNGCKVVYTIAAHDVAVSKREHEALGIPFNLPHLTDPKLWYHYSEGYRLADVIVCPSTVAEKTVRDYSGVFAAKDIRVIPHGCTLPEKIKPLPNRFVCGYMGSAGVDKGVRYLLEAWKKLNYQDGSLLLLAGREWTPDNPWVRELLRRFGGGNIMLAGWQNKVSDFYNAITLYVQPSATEGFGLEVIEAMAHGRGVLCSTAAGAQDVVHNSWLVDPCDSNKLAKALDESRRHINEVDGIKDWQAGWRMDAEKYTWDNIRAQYKALWREVLG